VVTESAGWYLTHAKLCWIAERHGTLHRNPQGRLHCTDGPAIAYPDGWEIYALNGVRMSRELVMTPANQLDAQVVVQETNAEIRRELVRKMGVELVCQRLGSTVLDRHGDYELITLNLGDGRVRPYLKMKNPSIGIYHIEGVEPSCLTVQKALNWRNGTDQPPEVLS
jgi:hypothetical protein